MQKTILKLGAIKILAPTLVQVCLEQKEFSYQAGQYLEVLYPNDTFQPFSIANAPNDIVELHIRQLPQDQLTTEMLANLRNDKFLQIRGPIGKAIYQSQPENPVILVAGGTGFAYAKAIIEQAIANKDPRNFHLYWGVKTPEDFYLPHLPQIWQKQLPHFSYTPVVSQWLNYQNWQGRKGYLANAVITDYPDLSDFQIYLSGPQAIV